MTDDHLLRQNEALRAEVLSEKEKQEQLRSQNEKHLTKVARLVNKDKFNQRKIKALQAEVKALQAEVKGLQGREIDADSAPNGDAGADTSPGAQEAPGADETPFRALQTMSLEEVNSEYDDTQARLSELKDVGSDEAERLWKRLAELDKALNLRQITAIRARKEEIDRGMADLSKADASDAVKELDRLAAKEDILLCQMRGADSDDQEASEDLEASEDQELGQVGSKSNDNGLGLVGRNDARPCAYYIDYLRDMYGRADMLDEKDFERATREIDERGGFKQSYFGRRTGVDSRGAASAGPSTATSASQPARRVEARRGAGLSQRAGAISGARASESPPPPYDSADETRSFSAGEMGSCSPGTSKTKDRRPPRGPPLCPIPENLWDREYFLREPTKSLEPCPLPPDLWNTKKYFPKQVEKRFRSSSKKTKGRALENRELINLVSDDSDSICLDRRRPDPVDRRPDPVNRRPKKRRRVRKIMKDSEVSKKTREAEAYERERCRLLEERRQKYPSVGSTSTDSLVLNPHRAESEHEICVRGEIARKAHPYQRAGMRFMFDNVIESLDKLKSDEVGKGCILSHLMGLGKTMQAVGFISAFLSHEFGRHVLLLAPKNVLENWCREFSAWLPEDNRPHLFELHKYSTNELRQSCVSDWNTNGGVLLAGYEIFVSLCRRGADAKGAQATEAGPSKCDSAAARALLDNPKLLVLDEGHRIKNDKNRITKVLKELKTRRCVVLTGTPMQNNLEEYYHMIDFVRPNLLGSLYEFRNRFKNPIEAGQDEESTRLEKNRMRRRIHVLRKLTKEFIHRRDLNDVPQGKLPQRHMHTIFVGLSDLQKKLYRQRITCIRDEMARHQQPRGSTLFKVFHALLKVCNHPKILLQNRKNKRGPATVTQPAPTLLGASSSADVPAIRRAPTGSDQSAADDFSDDEKWFMDLVEKGVDFDKHSNSGKLVLTLEILESVARRNEKVLIFSQSLGVLDLLERELQKRYTKDAEYFRIDGKSAARERQDSVQAFNTSQTARVFLISTKAGGEGINLYGANHAILYDVNWNPARDLQAIFRIYRFGQTRPVHVYRLVAHRTMEHEIYKRSMSKESMALRVVDKKSIRPHFNTHKVLRYLEIPFDESETERESKTQSLPNDPVMHWLLAKYGPQEVANEAMQILKSRPLQGETEALAKESRESPDRIPWIEHFHRPHMILKHDKENVLTEEEKKAAEMEYNQSLKAEGKGATASSQPIARNRFVLKVMTLDLEQCGNWLQSLNIGPNFWPKLKERITCGKDLLRMLLNDSGPSEPTALGVDKHELEKLRCVLYQGIIANNPMLISSWEVTGVSDDADSELRFRNIVENKFQSSVPRDVQAELMPVSCAEPRDAQDFRVTGNPASQFGVRATKACFISYLRKTKERKAGTCCNACALQGRGRHCKEWPDFLDKFLEHEFTAEMAPFLPNLEMWKNAGIAKFGETPRVVAALKMIRDVYKDPQQQILKSAQLSLDYLKKKYLGNMTKEQKASFRWVNEVVPKLPMRPCFRKNAEGHKCTLSGYGLGQCTSGGRCQFPKQSTNSRQRMVTAASSQPTASSSNESMAPALPSLFTRQPVSLSTGSTSPTPPPLPLKSTFYMQRSRINEKVSKLKHLLDSSRQIPGADSILSRFGGLAGAQPQPPRGSGSDANLGTAQGVAAESGSSLQIRRRTEAAQRPVANPNSAETFDFRR